MAEHAVARAIFPDARPLQRKPALQVRPVDDEFECEADRAADAVMSGRGLAAAGASLSHVPISQVQRDEAPKTEEDKYKKAAEKLGEAFLKTPLGEKLKEEALNDPLVKGIKEAGESFIGTLPGKIVTGAAAVGAVAALAAAHKELPLQIPEIPLDRLTPGLSVKITYEGPVDNPTKALISFSYKEQASGKKKSATSKAEKFRAETARIAADQEKFRSGMKFAPGSPEAERQAAEDDMIRRAAFRGVGSLPGFNAPLQPPQPAPGLQLQPPGLNLPARKKPLRLLDQELQLRSAEELGLQSEPRKKEEEAVQRKAAGSSRPSKISARAAQAIDAPGAPLDAAVRGQMETRFGADFSSVRIHADTGAARAARSIGALAYTTGPHIVFSEGTFSPHTSSGKRLLAHELAHVVQQSAAPTSSPIVQRKPKDPPAAAVPVKWYQDILDKVRSAERDMAAARAQGRYALTDPYYDYNLVLLKLCEAVDSQQADAVKAQLEALFKRGMVLYVGLQVFDRGLLTEMSARMYEMGLEEEARKLREAYAKEDKFGPYNDDIYAARRKVDFHGRLVNGATADAKSDTPQSVAATAHRFARVFVVLRDAFVAIDMEGVERDRQSGGFYRGMRPGMSHLEYYETTRGQIWRWQEGLSTFIQQAMDMARADLESPQPTGAGVTLLKALQTALKIELHDVIFPKDQKLNIAGLSQETTKTTIKKGKGTIADSFPNDPSSAKRTVPVDTYDPAQEFVRELHASLAAFWRIRMEQLNVLGRIYGVLDILTPQKDFAEGMRIAEAATDNAQTIRNMSGGRLRLDSDDDWRVFLLQKFNDMVHPAPAPAPAPAGGAPAPAAKKAATPAEALHAIIALLFDYLQAFTVHARFTNIYDAGDVGYTNRPFPRALTGQLVHDCGVYALRVAYMLSLVRKELGLKFRFVTLPVHVSLVITGDKLPTFIIENDQFHEISVEEMERSFKAFSDYKDPTTGAAPAGPTDEEQFIGELAASDFISGPLDAPFKVTDVPPPVSNAKAEQLQLWNYYKTKAVINVFGPSSQTKGDPNYLFHQNYLALTEEKRQMFNEYAIPFWNKAAPDAWDEFMMKIGSDPKTKTARSELPVDGLMTPLGEYKGIYTEALKPLKARYARFEDDERRLSQRLRNDPKLSKAGVRISVGARSFDRWQYYWDLHAQRITAYEKDLVVRPADAAEKIDAVTKTLQPPFIPRDEKKFEPLD